MDVLHDPHAHRFYVKLGQYEAALSYARRDNVLDFYHVYVPESHRGRGLAGRICKAAFEYARAEGLKVVPTCPFISGEFLPRFPQYQDLVEPTKGETPHV